MSMRFYNRRVKTATGFGLDVFLDDSETISIGVRFWCWYFSLEVSP